MHSVIRSLFSSTERCSRKEEYNFDKNDTLHVDIDANIPNKFWGEAVVTANFIQNRVLTRVKERTQGSKLEAAS